jgi:hypothetical protein
MNSRVKRIKLSAAITDDDQTAAMMEICFNNDNDDVENVNDIDLPLIEKHCDDAIHQDDNDGDNDRDDDHDPVHDDQYGFNNPIIDSGRKRRFIATTVDGIRSINQRIKENAYEMKAMDPSEQPFLEYRRINNKDCLWCSICGEIISAHKSHVKGHINTKYHNANKMKYKALNGVNFINTNKSRHEDRGNSIKLTSLQEFVSVDVNDSDDTVTTTGTNSNNNNNNNTTTSTTVHSQSNYKLRSRNHLQQSFAFTVGHVINDSNTTSMYQLLDISPIKSLYKYNNEHSINLAGGIPLEACFPFHSMQIYLEDKIGDDIIIPAYQGNNNGSVDGVGIVKSSFSDGSCSDIRVSTDALPPVSVDHVSSSQEMDSVLLTKSIDLFLNYHLGEGMPVVVDWVRQHVHSIHHPLKECGISLTNGSTDAWFKVLTMISGDCILFDEYAYSSAITPCQCLGKQIIGMFPR